MSEAATLFGEAHVQRYRETGGEVGHIWKEGSTVLLLTTTGRKSGEPRILKRCTYPLTAPTCVKRIYTNLAVIDVTPQGLLVIEMIAGMTLEKLQASTEPGLQLAPDWQVLAPPETPEARVA